LLEATKIAGGASGKAGGLLALWAYPSCIVPLSYKLHQELSEKHGGADRWGYRAVHCGQVDMYGILANKKNQPASNNDSVSLQKRSQKAIGLLRAAGVPKDLDWIAAEGLQSYEEMGTPLTTAQVHPYQFTTSMAALAEERGVKIIYGSATSIAQESGAVTSVSYKPKDLSSSSEAEEKTIQADTIILTAGPWTKTLLKSAPISALRAHSVTIRPSKPISAYCLFTSIDLPHPSNPRKSTTVTPEIYARPNNEVYACGEGDHLIPLPTSSDLVQCDESKCDEIVQQVGAISEELRDGEVTARQACYLPNVEGRGGGPLVGETSVKGLLIGAGHTCWGIQVSFLQRSEVLLILLERY
jgi:glycine/D-amino acid oxidase-like deaminating enzyme